MKLENLQEAKTAALKTKISKLRRAAEEMDSTRKLIIKELRELERATSGGDWGIVDKASENAGLSDRWVHKLYNYPGDLSTTMFVKVLRELEKIV